MQTSPPLCRMPSGRSAAVRYRCAMGDAVQTLAGLLDEYEQWRDNLPESLTEGSTAQRIEELLELRDLVDQLQNAELPRGFGRD
jgi:hypothetical protein